MRKDGRFTRIPSLKVELMREAKKDNCSLKEIGQALNVAKSTVSYYCRDLFDDPQRIYQTEEDAREVIALRSVGQDHNAYHKCINCGKTIRMKPIRCLVCSLAFQETEGERDRWIGSGIPTRFKMGNRFGAIK